MVGDDDNGVERRVLEFVQPTGCSWAVPSGGAGDFFADHHPVTGLRCQRQGERQGEQKQGLLHTTSRTDLSDHLFQSSIVDCAREAYATPGGHWCQRCRRRGAEEAAERAEGVERSAVLTG